MKRYPAYQKTELPWLKEVPVTWQLIRNKQFLTERKEFVGKDASKYPLLSLTKQGVILRDVSSGKGKFPKEFDSYKVVEPSNAIFCLFDMDETPRTIGISKYRGMITGAYDVFELSNINSRFFYYYYASLDDKKDLKPLYTGLRKTIGVETFLHAKMPVPSKEEQQQIVLYLDTKTAQIDCAIRGYERLVALLEERKTAVINEAVTKGVRRGVEMKKSGVDWLGEIPAHWEISNVKKHFHIQKDIAGREGYDVLSITQTGLKKKNIASNEGQMANDYSGYQFVHQGEFAMNHMDLLTGYIGLSPYFGVTSPDYRVFVLDDKETCDAKYFLYVFQLGYKRKIFYKFGRGAASKGRWRLPARAFLDYVIPLPPIDEQRDIVRLIDEQQAKLDKAIAGIQREIELLHERRTRLVSDVVTGQVDVRTEVLDDGDGCVGAGAGEADHALSV